MNLRPHLALLCTPLLVLPLLAAGPKPTVGEKPVTVFVVRHAEKAKPTDNPRDPELSEIGKKRAKDLGRLLSKAGVTHLYSTELKRTRHTLLPLAKATKLEVQVVPAAEGQRQVEELRSLPSGSVAVVAGHSNTVPAFVSALGGEMNELVTHERYGEILADDAYDRLVMVTLPAGEGAMTKVIELRYGD